MTRQSGSPGVDLPELRAALLAHLASLPQQPELECETEAWAQDELPGDRGLVKDEDGLYQIPAKAGEPWVEIDCSCGCGLNAPERLFDYLTGRHAHSAQQGHRRPGRGSHLEYPAPGRRAAGAGTRGAVTAPVQVRISGAADDTKRLAEYLAAIPGISASAADIKARPSGIAHAYLTVNLESR
jgi:hypothetical protein